MTTDNLISNILASYDEYGCINLSNAQSFPNRQNVIDVLVEILTLIFPGFRTVEQLAEDNLRYVTGARVNKIITGLTGEIKKATLYLCRQRGLEQSACTKLAEKTAISLVEQIPEIRRKIILDIDSALKGDPAAGSTEEIILSYPGIEAIAVHRIAHELHQNGVPIIPRIMSEYIHGRTGIDIHPGATIGEAFFIDHGTGVVVGETTIIGNNVKLYQGVTLGALSVHKEQRCCKRHPTIQDNVTIYAGATILGGDTVIGEGSIIGGNTWVTESVPPRSIITIN